MKISYVKYVPLRYLHRFFMGNRKKNDKVKYVIINIMCTPTYFMLICFKLRYNALTTNGKFSKF